MALNFLKSFRSGSGQSDPTRALGGRYTITKQLGAGGFGQTFLARDLHLPGQPQCVVKQLKPHDRGAQQLQVARRLFDTEARALYQLGAHPQIPRLLAHFEDGGEFYLAQELIDGHSLTTEFNSRRPWSEADAVAFLGDVLGTLTFVHDHRVIHRDLKPSNLIRRQQDNRIVLIDFGAVKRVGTQLISAPSGSNPTVAVGTQGYMPSEQLAGQPRFSSDIYAVGIMGIQALTGQPLENLTHNEVTGEIDWHYHVPKASPALLAVIDRMVRYDFRTRYATAREALTALQQMPPGLSQHLPPMMTNSEIGAIEEKAAEMTPDAGPTPNPPLNPPKPDATQRTVAVAGQRPMTVTEASDNRGATNAGNIRPASASEATPIRAVAIAAIVIGFGLGALVWRALTPAPSTVTTSEVTTSESAASEQDTESASAPITTPPSEPANSRDGEQAVDEDTTDERVTGEVPPAAARATVADFYEQVSAESWGAARDLTAGSVAQQFDPDFFQQFERVTVTDLRVTDQDADTLTLVGQNIYRYDDGSSQLEERSFTVQLIDNQPRIVDSDFIRVIQKRR